MKNSMLKRTMYTLLAAATTASTFGGTLLATGTSVFADFEAGNFNITNGVYNHSPNGGASIRVNGNTDQPLEQKTFTLYKIFDAENAAHNESINYTFVPEYEQAVKNVVAQYINSNGGFGDVTAPVDASQITEYIAIDYIQSLNEHYVEGAQADQELNSSYSTFRYFIEDLRDEIKRLGVGGANYTVQSAASDNSITIGGLDYGYYLLDETSTKGAADGDDGTTAPDWFASALCMVDTANPNAEVNIKSDYPSIIKKIQEDDLDLNSQEVASANGWNDIGDYEIGQTVPYKYESTICNMNGFDSYYYAMHDQMDSELTFDGKSSVKITINAPDGRTWSVPQDEFNVSVRGENQTSNAALDTEDTFMIEIPNIKTLIDQNIQAPAISSRQGEYDYTGYSVTTEYTATLNDTAALDTGRPGFENDVRLEFSNDFDTEGLGETGYTPWDTVVCFTFKINGLKVNDHDNALEGAKFRLYSDAECKNEVYVKLAANNEDPGVSTLNFDNNDIDHVTPPTGDEENFDGEKVSVGDQGYIVINRDSLGGDDHTGGTAPAEAVEMTSDADGNFTIYGLDQGTYWLKEVDAPDGYRQLLDPIQITITPTYDSSRNDYIEGEGATDKTLVQLKATAHVKAFYEGETVENDTDLTTDVADGSASIKIVNEVGAKLPVTGSNQMLILLGAGVALMGGAVLVSRRKKTANN